LTVQSDSGDGPPRALLVTAIVVAVGAVIALLIVAALRQSPAREQPVAIVAVPAPQADSAECRTLAGALPEQMGDFRRAPAADPAPAGAAAWRTSEDGEAVILRCGVDRPAEFVVGSPLQGVDNVQWFEISDQGRSTWFAVDRPVYIALTLPPGSGPAPIQEISGALAKLLPAKPIDPAPVR
jgi:Protein of unknown function (DUF3515)